MKNTRAFRSPFASRDAELAKLRAEVEELRSSKHVERFAKEVGDNIMLMLANTPYERWPEIGKVAYKHAADRQEVSAYMYRQRLPK